MSLYRQPGRRSRAAVAVPLVAGVIIGGVAGYLGGRASRDEPTLSQQIAELRSEARPLELAIQQVRIEYRGTVRDGNVVSPTEYQAARASVQRAAATLHELEPDLRAVDRIGADRLRGSLASLRELVARRAPENAVDAQAAATFRALSATVIAPRTGAAR
jgi:hypothetical protein